MANLRRNETVQVVSGSYVAPGAGYFVNAYAAGGVASGPNVLLTIPLYLGHGFQANDYAMKGISTAAGSIALVDSVTTTSITVHTTLTATAGDVFINIGPDTGGTTPTWIQSSPRIVIYSTPTTATTITDSILTCDSGGNYGYWYDVNSVIWELIRNTAGVPVAYVIQNSNVLLTSSDGSVHSAFTDNSIARWDGTTGLIIQGGYSSNTPTISDAGAIAAPGSHTFGPVAVTGALSATGALSGAATTVTTLHATGAATLDSGLAVTGAISATTSLSSATLATTGDASLAADTTMKRIRPTLGAALTAGATPATGDFVLSSGWGNAASKSVSGKGTAFELTVNASGTTTIDPTIEFTYPDGTYTTAPFPIVILSGGTGAVTTLQALCSSTATKLTITLKGTPASGSSYVFTGHVLG